MNAWLFGTIVLGPTLWLAVIGVVMLVDRQADRHQRLRDPYYQRPLPARRGPVIDAVSRPVRGIDR